MFFENDGALIRRTDFFDSNHAKAGKVFVSVNAGTLRLLIPSSQAAIVQEIKSAKYVILSRGPWPAERQTDGFEILFEDESDSPFVLHLSTTSFDLLPADPDPGRGWRLSAWVEGPKKVGEWRCHYRRVAKIPWLKPL